MRTGGSQTFENGKLVSSEEPTKDHPEGNRPRDVDGKPLGAGRDKGAAADHGNAKE